MGGKENYVKIKDESMDSSQSNPNAMRQKRKCPIFYIIFGLGISCLIIGTVILIIWPYILHNIRSSQFVLGPDTEIFKIWRQTPPLNMDFYLFNWTNSHDFGNGNSSVKPRFEQIGPYRFKETKKKVDITWNANGTVTYKQMKTWYLDEDFKDGGDLDDILISMNPVMLAAAYTIRDWDTGWKSTFSLATDPLMNITIRKKVREMLFEGYTDHILSLAKSFPIIGAIPRTDKFGWFYERNNSIDHDGIFTAGRGLNFDLGKIYRWNSWTHTPYFDGKCGEVYGSAGEFQPSHLGRESISFFSPDMCKTVTLDYEQSVKVQGILGYKFSAGKSLLDNGTLVPENQCNCVGDCLPSGVLNISTCRFGSPAFVSLPHFHKADPFYINAIDGVQPDESKHDFFMVIEPETGLPIQVSARLQINMFIQPIDKISTFENVQRMMIPMLWFEQKIVISDGLAFKLRMLINFPIIFTTIGIVFLCLGVFMISCVCYKICTFKICQKGGDAKTAKEQVPLNDDHNDSTRST